MNNIERVVKYLVYLAFFSRPAIAFFQRIKWEREQKEIKRIDFEQIFISFLINYDMIQLDFHLVAMSSLSS